MPNSSYSKKIMIVTYQDIHRSDRPTTGGSLRAYNLGEALRECGHSIVYSIPENCIDLSAEYENEIQRYAHRVNNIKEIVADAEADIVIFCNWGLVSYATELDLPVVVDMNGSLVLENYYRGHSELSVDALAKLRALSKVDLILTGSETQKKYLIAWCLMAGMNPESLPIEVVPFSLPPRMPEPRSPAQPIFVMAGYEWPWLDGQKAVEIVSQELGRLGKGKLEIYSESPPYTDILPGEDSSKNLIGVLQVADLDRTVRKEPVSFSRLTEILSRCSVALDVWNSNLERELAFPTRTAVYLWSGLPVICSTNGDLAKLIRFYDAGWTVDIRESCALSDLVRRLVTAPGKIVEKSVNAQSLASNHLTWDKTIAPLNSFCNDPFKNRHHSPFLVTLDKLNKVIFKHEKLITNLQLENSLMGKFHKRAKGIAVIKSRSLMWFKLKRLLIGMPILLYLFSITCIGQYLYLIWMRYQRR
jgi:hypothetical protein